MDATSGIYSSATIGQKDWVRRVAEQWRGLGLHVFFDEDTILPGADTVTALEHALENSRHVVLVITPQSVASRWVAMESAIVMFQGSDASDRRLIPVLLEPTPDEDIRLSVRRLSRVDLTDSETRQQRYRFLMSSLGITEQEIPTFPNTKATPATEATGGLQTNPLYRCWRAEQCGQGHLSILSGMPTGAS